MSELPEVTTFYSEGEIVRLVLLTVTGLLPFWPIRLGVLELPLIPATMYEDPHTPKNPHKSWR